ncbi:hypothetical protein [Demequina activiva]|uniref:Uncharacterized protein n=1 Tax=Demequina activiva TaxID=1582364 RepID=A0A919Q234_9MICO|nr:hypothetical protein [Demequina activiva]GIG54619.1 hypothetical protein Dac01nite_13710 [Demequina activiva]
MLNSKYAPIIALTVVAIIIVLALGWFLAVSPQIKQTGELADRAEEVEGNTVLIETASAQLDAYASELEAAPDYSDAVALNAPSVFDEPVIRARLATAVEESGVEIVSLSQAGSATVEGWTVAPGALVSTQIAGLFVTGPLPETGETSEFQPAVTPPTADVVVTDGLVEVAVTLSVAGTPEEALEFFELLADPAQQLFQLYNVQLEARQSDSSPLTGVSQSADGDVQVTATGAFYLQNPDYTVVDEGVLEPAPLTGDSPFAEVGGADPQPGAS